MVSQDPHRRWICIAAGRASYRHRPCHWGRGVASVVLCRDATAEGEFQSEMHGLIHSLMCFVAPIESRCTESSSTQTTPGHWKPWRTSHDHPTPSQTTNSRPGRPRCQACPPPPHQLPRRYQSQDPLGANTATCPTHHVSHLSETVPPPEHHLH